MKKNELKNYSIVETRDGNRYIKLDCCLIKLPFVYRVTELSVGYLDLNDYNVDLTHRRYKCWDVMKINDSNAFNLYGSCKQVVQAFNMVLNNCIEWSWERQENILTDKERNYLKTVIEPVKDNVTHIKKKEFINDMSYIYIALENPYGCDYISLYTFPLNTQFKGMELEKEYTLKELGL